MTEVIYLRLISGEQIVCRYVSDIEGIFTVDFPMLIENRTVDGSSAVNLVKYLPFTNHNEQVLVLNKNHIVAMSPVSLEFTKYFMNNWQYTETFITPQTDVNMIQINKNLEGVLSPDNKAFSEAVNKHANQIPNIISYQIH
jgi:hypothetical protein